MKISKLEIENVKRVKAVSLEPTQNGLTVIGGRNNQGKTSVLDSIAWALGGDKFKPTSARRDGSVVPPFLHVEMDNGLVVERKGENSSLKVIDPAGRKGGQQLQRIRGAVRARPAAIHVADLEGESKRSPAYHRR